MESRMRAALEGEGAPRTEEVEAAGMWGGALRRLFSIAHRYKPRYLLCPA